MVRINPEDVYKRQGFIDITQNAKCIVFCTTFTAKGLRCAINGEGVRVEEEGSVKKFVNRVSQISFNGKMAVEKKQKVVFVTERAVFRMEEKGLVLIELAPGVDLENDILAQMEFVPAISEDLRPMDMRLYRQAPFGLRELLAADAQ